MRCLSLPLAPSRKGRVLHAVTTHLRINLQEDRSGFGFSGRHSYTTALVMKTLNVGDIENNYNPVYLGNTVQWSHKGGQVVSELIVGGEDGEDLGVGAVEELNGMWKVQYLPPWQILRNQMMGDSMKKSPCFCIHVRFRLSMMV